MSRELSGFRTVTTRPGPVVALRPTRPATWMYCAAVLGWRTIVRRPRRSTSTPTSMTDVARARSTHPLSPLALVSRSRAWAASPLEAEAVSYTHLRAHETRHELVCR